MRATKCIITLFAVVLSTTVMAESSQSVYPSVLPPGAKIVAGDLSKNEFFIVAGNSSSAVKAVSDSADKKTESRALVPVIRTALNQARQPAAKQKVPTLPAVKTAFVPISKPFIPSHKPIKFQRKTIAAAQGVSPVQKTAHRHKMVHYTYRFKARSAKPVNDGRELKVTLNKVLHKSTASKPGARGKHQWIAKYESHQFAPKKKIAAKRTSYQVKRLSVAKL
ncbi:hypothetical protein [Aquicella lusitana]|uniref:Uncharacterized protein n=1 Tax=Aquicella lusitana TaxID=254246 RepID=A0A370GLM1_9COXI|nr:hypothetical protein [Aquicella lusitana]RDI44571.1 hypothetical protein C8D86_10953 [Aquicella lusitana]VVC72487.1 hypothetical protein AQULUS_01990 [Aquicella lusitana]